jgi:hypothetical protein
LRLSGLLEQRRHGQAGGDFRAVSRITVVAHIAHRFDDLRLRLERLGACIGVRCGLAMKAAVAATEGDEALDCQRCVRPASPDCTASLNARFCSALRLVLAHWTRPS